MEVEEGWVGGGTLNFAPKLWGKTYSVRPREKLSRASVPRLAYFGADRRFIKSR